MATKKRYSLTSPPTFAPDARQWADSFRPGPGDAEAHIDSLGTPLSNHCIFCGHESDGDPRDHIFPTSKGGLTVPGNMLRTCPKCNFGRQNISVIDFWRRQDPATRWYKDEKSFFEAFERLVAPFKRDYPEHYERAMAIQEGSQSALEELYRIVAEYQSTLPRFEFFSDQKSVAKGLEEFYLKTEGSKRSLDNASAFAKLSSRNDSFAQAVVRIADSASGSKSTQQTFRSNVARAALAAEKCIDFEAKKSQQKKQLKLMLTEAKSGGVVTPYRKLFEGLGKKHKHLATVAAEKERELNREASAAQTKLRQEARLTMENFLEGKLKEVTPRDSQMLDYGFGHPKTNRLAIFERGIDEVASGRIQYPQGYTPNAKAREAIKRRRTLS